MLLQRRAKMLTTVSIAAATAALLTGCIPGTPAGGWDLSKSKPEAASAGPGPEAGSGGVLMLGDSITAFGVGAGPMASALATVVSPKNAYVVTWPGVTHAHFMTPGLLSQGVATSTDYATYLKPKVGVLQVGTNDAFRIRDDVGTSGGYTMDDAVGTAVAANINAILANPGNPNGRCVLLVNVPTGGLGKLDASLLTTFKPVAQELNRRLRDLDAGSEAVKVIDWDAATPTSDSFVDDVHPTPAAGARLRDLVADAVNTARARTSGCG